METVFSKILRGEIPTEFLYRDEDVAAFRDIRPMAPVHILIIPTKPIESIAKMDPGDESIVGRLFLVAKQIAEDLNISEKGYKLLIRVGRDGGQEIPHLHLHLLGGARLRDKVEPVEE